MYYIYHIPGKKIGVTSNLMDRVTRQQGYALGEYEVLLTSEDIDYVSDKEIELQKSYGYKVDRQSYKNLIKSNIMKINITEQTSTFAVPLNKLKGNLMDNLGLKWQTDHGEFEITTETVAWIMSNAKKSMFNDNRTFIYNKAFSAAFNETYDKADRFELIRQWADAKGIYDKGDSKTQYIKLMEEAGELAKALLNNDRPEVIDAIGDIVVVLTNLAALEKLDIEDCIDSAYGVIKSRKGKMENGTFVKEVCNSSTTLTKEEVLSLKRNTGQLTNPKVPNYSNQPFETL